MDQKIVSFPVKFGDDIPSQLRDLADRVERGEFGTVHSVTWVADQADGKVEVGHLGQSPLPGPVAVQMLFMGMQKLTKS